jgi:hypothetical protein
LVHPLEQILEGIEAILPEAGHLAGPVDQRRERAELRAVMCLAALVAVAHQPGLLENAKVLGDRRLGDSRPRRQGSNRFLSFAAQPLEQRPPSRIGERAEKDVR